MGTGSSCCVKKFDKSNQTGSQTTLIPKPPESLPSKSHEPVFVRVPKQTNRQQQRASAQGSLFELDTNIEEYSAIWDYDTKVDY